MEGAYDPGLDALLALNGGKWAIDQHGDYWVKFVVTQVPESAEKPHGLDYSLTLHGPTNERLIGFDNAHPVGRGSFRQPFDHWHRGPNIRAYAYIDAVTLLEDFWSAVVSLMKELGAA